MTSICIVGAGATGLLLLLLLQEAKVDISTVTIIDPHFDGGDLARRWTSVVSNTPWSKAVNALKAACPSLIIPDIHPLESTTPLIEIAHLLRLLASPSLKKSRQIQGQVVKASYDSANKLWTTTVEANGFLQTLQTQQLVLTIGSEPKSLDLPIPSIPLEVALDTSRLKNYVKKGDKVIVFGTMHSGTLVIQNLVTLGTEVTAYYKAEKPFYWARDGTYDGIKADAADIADSIVAGTVKVTLVSTADTAKVIRSSQDAQWVVYAMGFYQRTIEISVDGNQCSSTDYDGQTGRLLKAPAWGFGIAYPNRAPDGINWDVSVASFLEHMKPQIPEIIKGN